eukprot:scaffold3685_cov102-Isochrysis_galbana.AAC.8
MEPSPWRGEAAAPVPPLGMLLIVGSTTIAAMLFMTVLALAIVCRCGHRRPAGARLIAVAVPVIEVTGIPIVTEVASLGAAPDPDERAPILEHSADAVNWRSDRGSPITANSAGGAGVTDATVIIGQRA